MHSDKIESNIHVKGLAKDLANLVVKECNDLNDEEKERFRFVFLSVMGWGEKKKYKEKPMSREMAKSFGQTEMPFGKFKGKRVDDTPLDYLEWVADNVSEFNKQIRRYLMSPYVEAERKAENE